MVLRCILSCVRYDIKCSAGISIKSNWMIASSYYSLIFCVVTGRTLIHSV